MHVLITYDVNTEEKDGQRRLQQVAKLCKNYGIRVQNSVFECVISEIQLLEFKSKLEDLMDTTKDNVRIYFLSKNSNRRIIILGVDTSTDVEGTIIL